jgi:hypothetical protein
MEDKVLILCDANDWAMLCELFKTSTAAVAATSLRSTYQKLVIFEDLRNHLSKILDRSQPILLDPELFEEIEFRLFPEAPDDGGEPDSWKPRVE